MQAYYYDNIIFSTSLYKLDYIIKERETLDNNFTVKKIKSKVLAQNQAYTNIFFKTMFDRLLPYCSYDYYIQLELENILGYSLCEEP
jgi:hypothetical protein